MRATIRSEAGLRGLLFTAVVALGAIGLLLGNGPGAAQDASAKDEPAKPNRYIGADKCKLCHSAKDSGDQYGEWHGSVHAKAFEVLATPQAKEAAKAKGIDDPQKAEACLKCHVTAFGLPAEHVQKGVKPAQGVQCESCHGPGEEHMKARMTAAAKGQSGDVEIPAGEIVNLPPAATCRACHNAESPTYKPFCYYRRLEQVRHLNPKKHTEEELAKMLVCGCGDDCPCDTECVETCPVPKSERK